MPLPFPLPPAIHLLPGGGADPASTAHISQIPGLRAGSMLYCKLYRFLRSMGGTSRPVKRQRRTVGER